MQTFAEAIQVSWFSKHWALNCKLSAKVWSLWKLKSLCQVYLSHAAFSSTYWKFQFHVFACQKVQSAFHRFWRVALCSQCANEQILPTHNALCATEHYSTSWGKSQTRYWWPTSIRKGRDLDRNDRYSAPNLMKKENRVTGVKHDSDMNRQIRTPPRLPNLLNRFSRSIAHGCVARVLDNKNECEQVLCISKEESVST